MYSYRARMEVLLALPFSRMLCPHDPGLQPREKLEAFVHGLTDSALGTAERVDLGYPQRTLRLALPMAQCLVFDGDKARIPAEAPEQGR